MRHNENEEIIYPEGGSFLQFISENTGQNIPTLDDRNPYRGFGMIAIAVFDTTASLMCLIIKKEFQKMKR